MDEAGALVLDPAESPAKRGLDFSLHRVCLVARHPTPPLHLRVAEAPGGAYPAPASALGDRQRRRRGPGGRRRLDDEVDAAVAVGHDLVAVGAVVVAGGGGRVGAVRAVVVGGGHRKAAQGAALRGRKRGTHGAIRQHDWPQVGRCESERMFLLQEEEESALQLCGPFPA